MIFERVIAGMGWNAQINMFNRVKKTRKKCLVFALNGKREVVTRSMVQEHLRPIVASNFAKMRAAVDLLNYDR